MGMQILHDGHPLNGVLRIKADGTQKATVVIVKEGAPGQGSQTVVLAPSCVCKISNIEGNFDPVTGQFSTVLGPTFEKGNVDVVVNNKKSFSVRFY